MDRLEIDTSIIHDAVDKSDSALFQRVGEAKLIKNLELVYGVPLRFFPRGK
jgi:hypothetical protein